LILNYQIDLQYVDYFPEFNFVNQNIFQTFGILFGENQIKVNPQRLIYKEVVRDRLFDPLATLRKRRCQFLTR